MQGKALHQTYGRFLLKEEPDTRKTNRTHHAPLGHVLLPAMVYLAEQTYTMRLAQKQLRRAA